MEYWVFALDITCNIWFYAKQKMTFVKTGYDLFLNNHLLLFVFCVEAVRIWVYISGAFWYLALQTLLLLLFFPPHQSKYFILKKKIIPSKNCSTKSPVFLTSTVCPFQKLAGFQRTATHGWTRTASPRTSTTRRTSPRSPRWAARTVCAAAPRIMRISGDPRPPQPHRVQTHNIRARHTTATQTR